jgi:acyl carrier protein
MSTETEVIQVIKEAACRQEAQLNDTLEDDLGLDSLDQAELVMMLEEAFDIDIDDDTAPAARTVKDVVELVADMVEGPA